MQLVKLQFGFDNKNGFILNRINKTIFSQWVSIVSLWRNRLNSCFEMELDGLMFATNSSTKYSKTIGCIFGQMQMTKYLICKKIQNLSRDEFDFNPQLPISPVSTLLRHMIYVENFYQSVVFRHKILSEKERSNWKGCLPTNFIPELNCGHLFTYYLNLWNKVRRLTASIYN